MSTNDSTEGDMFKDTGPLSGDDQVLSQFPPNPLVAGENPMLPGSAQSGFGKGANQQVLVGPNQQTVPGAVPGAEPVPGAQPGTALVGANLNNVLGEDKTNIVAIAAQHNDISSNSGLKKNLDVLLVKNYYAIDMKNVNEDVIQYLNNNTDSLPANPPTVDVLSSKTGNIVDNQDFGKNAAIVRVIRESIASIGETKTFKTTAGKNLHRVRVAGGDVGKGISDGASAVGTGISDGATGTYNLGKSGYRGITNLTGSKTAGQIKDEEAAQAAQATGGQSGGKFLKGQNLNLALYNALQNAGVDDSYQFKLAAFSAPCSQLIFGYTKDQSGKITTATGRFQAFGSGIYGAITGNFNMELETQGPRNGKYTITLSTTDGQVVKSIIGGLLNIPEEDIRVQIAGDSTTNTIVGGKRKTKRRKHKTVRFKVKKHRKTSKKHRKSNKKGKK